MNTDLLVKKIAQVALEHGYLHLGEFTLLDFIGTELGVSADELHRVLKELEAIKQKQPIGAYASIQFNDSDAPLDGAYFSFGDYLEDEEMDSYGVHDERIFYYAQGEHDLVALSKPNGGDFVVISYELEFQA